MSTDPLGIVYIILLYARNRMHPIGIKFIGTDVSEKSAASFFRAEGKA
jgi:hypothetical protein